MTATEVMTPQEHSKAVQEIYEAHASLVWRTLMRFGVPEADAADAMQDTFLIVHRTLDRFEHRCAMSTWLFTICRSVAKDRRQRAHVRHEVPDHDGLLFVQDTGPDALELVDHRQRLEVTKELLEDIPAEQREAFVLHEVEGLTGEQIAARMGGSPNTAHARIRLARRALFPRYHRRMSPQLTNEHKAHLWALLAPLLLKEASPPATAATTAATTTASAGAGLLKAYFLPAAAAMIVGAIGGAAVVDAVHDAASGTAASVSEPPPARPSLTTALHVPEAPVVSPEVPSSAALHPTSSPPRLAAVHDTESTTTRTPSALAEETAMIREARENLNRDEPMAAIAKLREAHNRFPEGALAEEREFLTVEAMTRLKDPGAEARREAFVDEHPNSPFVEPTDVPSR